MSRSVLLFLAIAVAAPAQAERPPPRGRQSFGSEADLRRSLRSYIAGRWGTPSRETRYAAALRDLNADGRKEALVYISGPDWCGSGGCNLWILTPRDRSWRMVAQTTVTWPPVRLLRTSTRGWRDIALFVAGGGIIPGYEAVLRFNGRSYRTNPSLLRAARQPGPPGAVLISRHEEGRILFPGRLAPARHGRQIVLGSPSLRRSGDGGQ